MAHSLVLHALIAVLSLFLFGVFAKWWTKVNGSKHVTTIYKINCFLMFGLFITHGMAVYKYWMVLYNDEPITDVFTWYLSFQQYFVLLPLLGYVVHVINKLRGNGNVNR